MSWVSSGFRKIIRDVRASKRARFEAPVDDSHQIRAEAERLLQDPGNVKSAAEAHSGVELPPAHLRRRVAGTDDGAWFVESGGKSFGDLQRALRSIGRSYEDFSHVLEWGCGCGRILRHLPMPGADGSLHGNEIDAEAVAWLSAHMPWVATSLTTGLPPLPYPDGSFDLIYNHSVMSHLDEDYQDAWLGELARVLRPGGVLTLTVHGQHAFDQFCNGFPEGSARGGEVAEAFYGRGLFYTKDDHWNSEFPDFYHTAFHSVGYIFEHWSKFLRVRQYIPRGALDYQDMVVLTKDE